MVTHCRGCQAGSGVGDRGGGGDGGGGEGRGGEGEGGGGGGSEGGEGHSSICVALPPNMKLRPLLVQQATPNVICAQYSCGGSVTARVRAGCGGAGCEGLRGAPHAPRTSMCPRRRTRPSFSSETHQGLVGLPGCPLRLLPPTSRTCLRTQGAGACWVLAGHCGRLLNTRRVEGA